MEPNITTSRISGDAGQTVTTNSLFVAAGDPSNLPYKNPFVGLRPFATDECVLFFGRNEQVIELLQQLHRTRFLAVVGSSGCGKSSLIRAGLISKLKAGFLIEDRDLWLTATMKPGDSPIGNLAAALLEAVSDGAGVEGFVGDIRSSGVRAIIERLTPALAGKDNNLLLLIDQFEEIFRFGVESNRPECRAEAEDFVSLMLALAEQRGLPLYVVMTMRSDFLGDCDNFYGLPEAMNRSQYLAPRLTRQQRQQAIEGPIRLFGGAISTRLLDRVLNDVGDKSDQLPVMQHALMRTWEWWRFENARRGDQQVDLPHYEAAGAIKDALSKDAEAALNVLSDDELKIAERMFQVLTDTDANNRRIRRPAHLSEILAVTGAGSDQVLKLIERFQRNERSFLTLTGDDDPLVDISHESLIRQWARLGQWVEAEKDCRELYLRLANAAKRRETRGAELWRGADLEEALKWREQSRVNAAWALRHDRKFDLSFDQAMKFLEESREAEEVLNRKMREKEKEEDEHRKRELRRTRVFAAVIGMAFLLSLAATWFAWKQQQQAKRQELYANQLYYDANMNFAQEAFGRGSYARGNELLKEFLPSPEKGTLPLVRDFLWYHLWLTTQETQTFLGHESAVFSVAFSPDGKTLATGSLDKTVKLWDVVTRQNVATLKGHESDVLSVAFSPDGKTLASSGGNGEKKDFVIRLWFAATDEEVARQRNK